MQVDGVHAFTLRTSEPDANNYVYLMRDGSPLVYLVSASRLSWLEVQAEQLTQSIYQPSEPEEIAQLQIISPKESYDFVVETVEGEDDEQVTCNGQPVDRELFGKLYQAVTSIPPERMSSGQPELEPALTMTVSYWDSSRPEDRFELIPNGNGLLEPEWKDSLYRFAAAGLPNLAKLPAGAGRKGSFFAELNLSNGKRTGDRLWYRSSVFAIFCINKMI